MGKKSIEIKIKDNSGKVLEELEEKLESACIAIGLEAEGFAKDQTPVDTGRLRNSITYATKSHNGYTHNYEDDEGNHFSYGVGVSDTRGKVFIGTNVEYAEAQETMDIKHRVGRAHFLRDSAAQHGDRYKAITKAALQS